MAYKKPEVVAKSEAKQSFVAGCPTNKPGGTSDRCGSYNISCMVPSRR